MRLVLTSDTHMSHERLVVPECDVVIHAGDFSRRGTTEEAWIFLDWLARQPARHKLLVAGNHDLEVERDGAGFRAEAARRGVTYLEDEAATVDGLRVWHSPVTPRFRNMAFNRDRGERIRAHWARIPEGLDVLITHGPPQGVLDRTFTGFSAGCADLLQVVRQRPPRLHVFGHIHEARGEHTSEGTRFLNVASRPLVPVTARPVVVTELSVAR